FGWCRRRRGGWRRRPKVKRGDRLSCLVAPQVLAAQHFLADRRVLAVLKDLAHRSGLADRLRLVVRPVLWGPAPPQTASLCVRIHGNGLLDSRPNLCCGLL